MKKYLFILMVALTARQTVFSQKNPNDSATSSNKDRIPDFMINNLVFDLGYANYNDQTNYSQAQNTSTYLRTVGGSAPITAADMTLNQEKSSNVNIWLFMANIQIKPLLALRSVCAYPSNPHFALT